jgi:flagellar FliL protein
MKRKSILLLSLLFLVIAGGVAIYYLNHKGKQGKQETVLVEIEDVEPIVINLADGHYVRMTISLGYTGDKKELEKKLPMINDVIITTAGAMTSKELLSPEGKELFKENLLLKLNSALSDASIRDVFFKEFIVQ